MGRFDGVIIVSDIDGTFLGKNGRMVPENMEAIEYFKREGGRFTVATGREIGGLLLALPNPGDVCNLPIIACNGAYLLDPDTLEVIEEVTLPEPEISRIADAARAGCPDIEPRVSVGAEYITARVGEMTRRTYAPLLGCYRLMPYGKIPRGCWHKLAWDGTPGELERVRSVVEPLCGPGLLVQLAQWNILEIQSVRGTKGAMLSRLKALSGRPDATLYAIGDYENDYVMLSMADHPVMPANGIDRLRTLPGIIEVCDHDEGAVADLIRRVEETMKERRERP